MHTLTATRVSTLESNLNLQPKEPPLATILWAHIQKSLDQTLTIESKERFIQIAKSMRAPMLDYFTIPLEPLVLEEMESLATNAAFLLQEQMVLQS